MAAAGATVVNFNNSSGKFNIGVAQNSSKEMELNQDLHLKMSKKIAQLTKVIYALNTKSDEHESVVASIKEKHEEQIQSILSDTKNKVEYYRQKLSDLKEEIKQTEQSKDSAKNYEADKQKILREMELFRKNADDVEMRLKQDHIEKLKTLTEQFAGVKKELESRVFQVDGLAKRYQKEKEIAVREAEERYQKRLAADASSREQHAGQLESLRNELKAAHETELESMRQKIESTNAEKCHLQEDFDAKLSKAQSFYEKELGALKNLQNSSNEERYKALTDSYENLQKEKSLGDNLAKQQIVELRSQLSCSEETISRLKESESSLSQNLSSTESKVSQLDAELLRKKNDLTRLQEDFIRQKTELDSVKMISEQQAKDLLTKSGKLAELEASTMQQHATIKDLTMQRDDLRQRIALLESLKQNLEKNSLSQVEEQEIRLRTLQKSIDDLTTSKEKLVQKYDEELKRIAQSSGVSQEKLMADHRLVVDAANQRHAQELSTERLHAETKLTRMKEDLEGHLDSERKRHEKETEVNRQELKQTKEDLGNQLSAANKEIERLESLVRESQESLLTANEHLKSVRDSAQVLQSELNVTAQKLKKSCAEVATLQKEYDDLKNLHETDLKKADEQLRSKLQSLRDELESKWKSRLKAECDQLRKDLLEQKQLDQKATIDQFVKVKDAEFATAKREWEKKVAQLLTEITELKKLLNETEKQQLQMLEKMEKQKDEALHQLRLEMMSSTEDYDRKMNQLKIMYTDEIETLMKMHEEEKKSFEDELKRQHMIELRSQVDSHKIAMTSLQHDLEKEKTIELDAQIRQNQQDLEDLRTELEQRTASEIERLVHLHSEELRVGRLELNRALEISREKDGENAMRISDLRETVAMRESTISRLQEEINALQESLEHIKKDLEQKAKDMIRLRNESNRTLKAREAELSKQLSDDRLSLESNHLSQTQEMIREFSSAQQLLKDKIAQLQNMLDEADEKYRNRESREEDLEKIRKLNLLVFSKDDDIKKLNAEKKHFQMELVNRETNFNKVFNADPKVGVLNPLAVMKKQKPKDAPHRIGSSSSAGTNGTGLNPLPGSPFHDEKLNSFKPLPPLPKKFLH